jgi:hypothetical protein
MENNVCKSNITCIKYLKKNNANMISIILESCIYIYMCVCEPPIFWWLLVNFGTAYYCLYQHHLNIAYISIYMYVYSMAFITISNIIIMYWSYPSFQSHDCQTPGTDWRESHRHILGVDNCVPWISWISGGQDLLFWSSPCFAKKVST